MRRSERAAGASIALGVPVAHARPHTVHRNARAPRAAFDSTRPPPRPGTAGRSVSAFAVAAASASSSRSMASSSSLNFLPARTDERHEDMNMSACVGRSGGEQGKCAYHIRVAVTPRACTSRCCAGHGQAVPQQAAPHERLPRIYTARVSVASSVAQTRSRGQCSPTRTYRGRHWRAGRHGGSADREAAAPSMTSTNLAREAQPSLISHVPFIG